MSTPCETIKRTVRVTIEKEIEIELTPAVFGPLSQEEYLAEFRKSLWHVDSIDDVVKYAARMAACSEDTRHEDGLGLIGTKGTTWPAVPWVTFSVVEDDCAEEILQ